MLLLWTQSAMTPNFFSSLLPSEDSAVCPGVLFHSVILCYILQLWSHRLRTQDKEVYPFMLVISYSASHFSWKPPGPFDLFLFCFVLFLISTGKDWLIMRLTSISNQEVWGVAGTSFNWHANAPASPVQSNQLGVYILLLCKALCELCSWKVLYK